MKQILLFQQLTFCVTVKKGRNIILKLSPDADPENDQFGITELPMVHGCKETDLCIPGKAVKV